MNEHTHRELDPPPHPLKRGDTGTKVRQVQEWLCLHGFHTAVDGDFGPATEAAVKAFLRSAESASGYARETGTVGEDEWRLLTELLRRVVEWKRPDRSTRPIGEQIADLATFLHFACRPCEVGKQNGGPWVRYYCRGQEVPWCAGFATTVVGQALGHDDWYTLSCDALAQRAGQFGVFLASGHWERERVRPGDLFLVRRHHGDWVHTGIVTAVHAEHFETIEGNTNTDGSREGVAVHARRRAFGPKMDFVLLGER